MVCEPAVSLLDAVLSASALAAYQEADDQRSVRLHYIMGQDSPSAAVQRAEAVFQGGAKFHECFCNEFPLLLAGFRGRSVWKVASLDEKGVFHRGESYSVFI